MMKQSPTLVKEFKYLEIFNGDIRGTISDCSFVDTEEVHVLKQELSLRLLEVYWLVYDAI